MCASTVVGAYVDLNTYNMVGIPIFPTCNINNNHRSTFMYLHIYVIVCVFVHEYKMSIVAYSNQFLLILMRNILFVF